ncbi:MAG: YceI family protein [Streptomycetaceae bacterium]|nr:YceI family protein [Streptomycetaceae bacterium]
MGLFSRTRKPSTAATAVAEAPAPSTDLSHLSGDYVVDTTHSRIGFSVRHAMVTNVRGQFTEYEGLLHLDGADPTASSAVLAIKVASIDTNQAQRDEHLRTGDFFEVEAHPEITFRSTSAQRLGDDAFRMTGDLTIKGTTRPVVLDLEYTGTATDPYGVDRVGFEGGTTIDRTEWGLSYNAALETGGVLIGEKVKLSFDISAVRKG